MSPERLVRWVIKPVVFAVCLVPAAYMLWSYYRTTKQREGAPIPATPTERRMNG